MPFCPSRCSYCDFDFTTRAGTVGAYLAALAREAEAAGGMARPRTVFFGGGTPSFLAEGRFAEMADFLRVAISLDGMSEWTIEANPETVTPEKARVWKGLGVTRISLGAQAFSDGRLAALGRGADPADTNRAWDTLRGAGFDNLNLDLIYGVPGTGLAEWRADLSAAVALGPDHVSVYALTVEEKTPLGLAVRRGKTVPVSEELSAALYQEAVERLAAAGLARYEVSNFSRAGKECRHNLHAWRGGEYLGIGSSAASFVGGTRGANARGEGTYRKAIRETGSAFRTERVLDAAERLRERVVLGLRLAEGVAETDIRQAGLSAEVGRLAADGLLAASRGRVAPTDRGFLFADEISAALV